MSVDFYLPTRRQTLGDSFLAGLADSAGPGLWVSAAYEQFKAHVRE